MLYVYASIFIRAYTHFTTNHNYCLGGKIYIHSTLYNYEFFFDDEEVITDFFSTQTLAPHTSGYLLVTTTSP